MLAVALANSANSGCYTRSYDLGRRCEPESLGSSGGTVEFDVVSRSLQRLFFRSVLFTHFRTTVKWPQILALYSTLHQPRALGSPRDTRHLLRPDWCPEGVISTRRQRKRPSLGTCVQGNDKILNNSCEIPVGFVSLRLQKNSNNWHSLKSRRVPTTVSLEHLK